MSYWIIKKVDTPDPANLNEVLIGDERASLVEFLAGVGKLVEDAEEGLFEIGATASGEVRFRLSRDRHLIVQA